MATASSSRLALVWAAIRDRLWFAPTVSAVTGAVLAVVAVRIPTPARDGGFVETWIFGGGTDGARDVLSTIAGSLITVTGVVFSVTIVALQLASSQFTPRVVGSFLADRVNQVVLGIFIGTFTYTLLVLRTIQSEGDDRQTFVPHVAVTGALVLLLVSIAALIVFINHAARSIQASVILQRETDQTLARIASLFPRRVGDEVPRRADGDPTGDADGDADGDALPADWPAGPPGVVAADRAGYLQALDASSLWAADGPRPLAVRMELPVGAFAFPGRALAGVWPAAAARDDRVARAVRAAFVLGAERTPEQDVELGLVALSDIAVRALSPSVNDPTTAMHCVDRLGQLLAALAAGERPSPLRRSPDGTVRLLARATSFERAAGVALDQIRHHGASNPAIGKRLLEVLRDLALVVPPALRPVLAAQSAAVLRAARREVADPVALAEVERLGDRALAAAEGRP
jgi:uncharacterized membrane protein